MSFDTYREFEASLQAARERRKKPNVNKNVLKKFILSTEAHNRNQEEQEMWMRHFASKKEETSSPRTHRKRKKELKKKKLKVSKCGDNESSSENSSIGPDLSGFLESKKAKWGHDGFHELYGDTDDPSSSDEKNDKIEGNNSRQIKDTDHHHTRKHKVKKQSSQKEHGKLLNSRSTSSRDLDLSEDSLKNEGGEIVKTTRKKKKKKRKKEKLEWVEK